MKAVVKYNYSDKIEQQLGLGDCVIYSWGSGVMLGTVVKFTPKMITVKSTTKRGYISRKYSNDVIKIEGPAVTMYLIKNIGK
jgi:hypothetical protein|tara:strand:- start:230 stop:475 length:246 start_codon:yes stop_codon:yes gene_type:complete